MGDLRVGGGRAGAGGEWRARHVPAAILRAAILVVPGLLSLAVVFVAGRLLPAPPADRTGLAVLRLVALGTLACTVAYVLERGARRLMPLVVLLRMSMLFPGRAPSRFRLARRACTTDVGRALNPRAGDDAGAVAERAVGLLAALTSHDRHTRGHSQRVQVLAEMLARELALGTEDRQRLRWAALLHDVGKLSVTAAVLNKAGNLDDGEWTQIRAHPEEGGRLCGPLLDWMGEWGLAIAQHHERFDGSGYPHGLQGAQISSAGRLVCLVDAYETMTAVRPYKKAMATRDARAELARCAGGHFDPAMVRAFLAISLPRLLWASGPLSFLAQLPFLPLVQAGGRTAGAALTAAGTGLVVGGAAVVIAATPAPSQAGAPVGAVGPGVVGGSGAASGASTFGSGSGPAGSGGQQEGTGPGGTTGVAAGPSASSAPSATATRTGSDGSGGSGSGGGSAPAPTRSGLLPPLTLPTLPGPLVSTVASALPSAVTTLVGGLLPSASAGGVTVTVPLLPPITLRTGHLLG